MEMVSLEEECGLLFDYLTKREPGEYVVEAYCRAHLEAGLISPEASGPDRELLRFASPGGWRLAAADAYARLFVPTSLLRKKLILALALAENSPQGSDRFNLEADKSFVRSIVELSFLSFRFLTFLSIGVLFLYPRLNIRTRL